MLGWELPPYNSGGLGTASLGLTEGLAPLGVSITFVVPKLYGELPYTHMEILDATAYGSPRDAEALSRDPSVTEELLSRSLAYGNRMNLTTQRREWVAQQEAHGFPATTPRVQAAWYAKKAAHIAAEHPDIEVIHTHDWMTYYAGMAAQEVMKKKHKRRVPIVAHVHATELDRSGRHGDPAIIEIERKGLQAADRVVAVSQYTKALLAEHYHIPPEHISVVHNGIPTARKPALLDLAKLKERNKIVLFMGRITMQKGPDYFVQLASAVTAKNPNVRFVMVGSGDMERKCIEQAARAGLTGKMLFSSFLRGVDVDRAYQLADLFVMPSVSEPFGIVALESMQNGTPVLVSKQSGVAEVSEHFIKVDFWDIEKMTEEVLAVLKSPARRRKLLRGGTKDLNRLSWHHSARTLHQVYRSVLQA